MIKETETYNSRKRAVTTLKSYNEELKSYSNDENDAQEENWRRKYEKLYSETKKLKKELQETNERNSKLEQYAGLLEIKNEHLLSSVASTSTSNSSTDKPKADVKVAPENESELEKIKKIINFYELMTCMKVELHSLNNTSDEYTCTIKNKIKRMATRFILRVPKPNNNSSSNQNLDFLPKVNINYLPEYLRARVNFEASNAPVMMGDILQVLFGDEGTDEAD